MGSCKLLWLITGLCSSYDLGVPCLTICGYLGCIVAEVWFRLGWIVSTWVRRYGILFRHASKEY